MCTYVYKYVKCVCNLWTERDSGKMHPILCKAQNGVLTILHEFRAHWISLLVLVVLARQLPHLSAILQVVGFGAALVALAVTVGWIATELFVRGPRVDSKGKAVLITGCDTGFGHNLAIRLATKEGYQVFAGCLQPNADGAQRLRSIAADDKKLHVVPLDVTNEEQIQSALRYVKTNLNGNQLWSVMANAGVNIFLEFEWTPIKDIEFLFDVNVMGVVRVSKAFLPLLRNSRGRLVLVSSYAGRIASSAIVPYSMTKAAVIAMADGLRREMAKWGLHVATVEPFFYRTAINPQGLQEMMTRFRRDVPLDLQQEYGEYPAQAFEWTLSFLERISRNNADEVVDQMVKAITDREPKRHYRCDGVLNGLLSLALFVLPSVAQDIAVSFFEPNFYANEKSGLLLPAGAPSPIKVD